MLTFINGKDTTTRKLDKLYKKIDKINKMKIFKNSKI